MFEEISFNAVPCNRDDMLGKLIDSAPQFAKYLLRYTENKYKYSDGTQDAFLSSIAGWVLDELKDPTTRQIDAFITHARKLELEKRERGVLSHKTNKEIKHGLVKSAVLLQIAESCESRFTPATITIFKSMRESFLTRGRLTDKQLAFLNKLVEELPEKTLEEEKQKVSKSMDEKFKQVIRTGIEESIKNQKKG